MPPIRLSAHVMPPPPPGSEGLTITAGEERFVIEVAQLARAEEGFTTQLVETARHVHESGTVELPEGDDDKRDGKGANASPQFLPGRLHKPWTPPAGAGLVLGGTGATAMIAGAALTHGRHHHLGKDLVASGALLALGSVALQFPGLLAPRHKPGE